MSGTERSPGRLVIPLDQLDHTRDAHDFVGQEHGEVPFCLILVHTGPGGGPRVHRHPYAEVFVVEEGEATFRLDRDEVVLRGRYVVIAPPNVPHGFRNTGTGELRLTAIHGAARFSTEWLEGPDPGWTSRRRR